MRYSMFILLFLSGINCFSQESGNYILIINGDSLNLDLDKEIEHKSTSGDEFMLKLVQPEYLTYMDEMISFRHHKNYNVSNTPIEEGVEQCTIIKSTGNGFLVQKYAGMNPEGLVELMIREITKESVSYGYKKSEKKFSKKLVSGQKLEGLEAILTYKGEKQTFVVATCGKKDEGILVITMMMNEDFKELDQPLIDHFLETLVVK